VDIFHGVPFWMRESWLQEKLTPGREYYVFMIGHTGKSDILFPFHSSEDPRGESGLTGRTGRANS
jgi:hypothetical protein